MLAALQRLFKPQSGFFVFIAVLFSIWTQDAQAEKYFEFTLQHRQAYLSFIEREPDLSALRRADKQGDVNGVSLWLEEYAAWLRQFATADPSDAERYESLYADAMAGMKGMPRTSPWYYYIKGEMELRRCISLLRKGSIAGAALRLKEANELFKTCGKYYPGFLPAKKDLLMLSALSGSLPEKYRPIAAALGFEGNADRAIKGLESLLAEIKESPTYDCFYFETSAILAELLLHLRTDENAALRRLEEASKSITPGPYAKYILAGMALKTGNPQLALDILQPSVNYQAAFPMLDYQAGQAYLLQTNLRARYYIGRFLKNYRGKQYVKQGFLRLSWAFLLEGKLKQAEECRLLVLSEGNTSLEEDKAALKEASLGRLPRESLLRSRLLFDGNKYAAALTALTTGTPAATWRPAERAEYYYRLGRIKAKQGKTDEAEAAFKKASMDFTVAEADYIPAAAMYYWGRMLEERGSRAEAIDKYRRVTRMPAHSYSAGFEQKARAGLARLK